MGKLKSIARSATVTWSTSSEHSSFLAAGTVAGAIDDSFTASATLEIFGVDFSTRDSEMPLLGSIECNDRFHSLAWGTKGIETNTFPYGLLAGGMVDATIKIWNPALIMEKSEESACIASVDRHTGPVRSLEFNPYQPNLLSSGASNSEVYITDLNNPAAPTVYSPGTNNAQNVAADIACVGWNRKVAHILASTSQAGTTVVWDLKLKRPVISFSDPNNRNARNSVVCWNPDVPTQLAIASEDDRHPVMQVWDLRNAFAPVKELHGHHKGILSASWCPMDSGMMLTSGKDNRTICWNPSTAEVLCELPSTNNWAFDVQWSPRIPAILSIASFDGQVGVYSLDGGSNPEPAANGGGWGSEFAQPQQPAVTQAALKQAPKWLSRPCGATFGFGGQLVMFNPSPAGSKPTVKTVEVIPQAVVKERAGALEEAVNSGDFIKFCDEKGAANALSSSRDATEWGLMRILCGNNSRSELIKFLGLGDMPLMPGAAAAAPPPEESAPTPPPPVPMADGDAGGVSELFGGGAPDADSELFSQMGEISLQAQPSPTPPAQPAMPGSPAKVSEVFKAPPSPAMAPDAESFLKKALMLGQFEVAVQLSISNGRMADALVLAASGGPDLWAKTRDAYLETHSSPFMKVVSAIVHQEFEKYVAESDLSLWKETLAILNTYSKDEELSPLCNALATRLETQLGDVQSAILCYMCAGNIQKATELWNSYHSDGDGALLDFMAKVVVFQHATSSSTVTPLMATKTTEYGKLLAAQGCMSTAMKYCLAVSTDDLGASVLTDRIFNSTCFNGQAHFPQPPPFPFERFNVNSPPGWTPPPSAAQAAASQAAQPTQANGGYDYSAQQQQPYSQQQYQQYDQQQYQQPQQQQQQYQQQYQQQPQQDYQQQQYQQQQYQQQQDYQQQQYQQQQYQQQQYQQQQYQQSTYQQPQSTYQQTSYDQTYQQQGYQQPSQPACTPNATSTATNSLYTSAQPPAAPQSATQPAPAPVPTPAPTPAPTMAPQAMDTAQHVPPAPAQPPAPPKETPPENKVVLDCLQGLMAKCGSAQLAPMDKRKMEDVSKRLTSSDQLFEKLSSGDISPSVVEKLNHICGAITAGDYRTALDIHVAITTSDWADNGSWLMGLKRLIEMVTKLQVR